MHLLPLTSYRIIVPTVGITLLATPAAPDLLRVPAPKNTTDTNNVKLRFVLTDIFIRFLLFVPAALVIYAWTFYFAWRSQVPGDLLPFSGLFGIGLRASFYTQSAYQASRMLAQNVMLFALVLFQAASSVTSLHCTYDIVTSFKRVPNKAWLCGLLLSVAMQVRSHPHIHGFIPTYLPTYTHTRNRSLKCVFFVVCMRDHLSLLKQVPWGVYVLAVLWLPVIVGVQELAKMRYRKFMETEEKWLREEFNTRLGMWSPKDV